MEDQIIKQFGKYRLIRLLGLGAFTDVHLGEHITSKKQVAVKVFKQSLSGNEEANFIKTVRAFSQLNHPNLIKMLDFDVENGVPFLIMTYASNGTLLQRHPKESTVPFAEVLNYVKQVAAALQYIHDQKFIHRGIRPGNIMLGSKNEILLSDCSFVFESSGAQSSHETFAEETIASMEYMAPEQLEGKPNKASDQYALGVLVYELLTGSTLFDDSSESFETIQKIYQILKIDPKPLREKNPNIPASIEEVVMKAIAKNWRERFESVQAFADALEIASLPVNTKRQNLAGKQFGNYRLISIIGQGGFANVYLAEQVYLKSKVAIKVLDKKLTNADEVKFLNEARMIANLRHPNVIGVLNYGVEDNMPFLVMNYAPNGTLRQLHPKGSILSPITILQYVKEASDALHYAHYQGIIHRDVKPENMLLGGKKEILLSDFGIAVAAHDTNEQGRQEIIGTLPYMAPEQIQGKPHRASDQYGLAIAIYEWLCGTCPFNGTPREITIGHLGITPKSLREHTPTLSLAVEEVVLKALTKDPLERYPTIQDFANAFEKACQNERPVPVIKPLVLPQNPSQIPQAQVPTNPAPLKHQLVLPPTETLIESLSLPSESTENHPPGTLVYTHDSHRGRVNSVVWSPGGNYLASAGIDRVVQVWNPNSIFNYRGHSGEIRTMAWSPSGNYLASAGVDHIIQVRDTTSGKVLSTYSNHAGSVFAVAWSPDGILLASAGDDETVQIWNAMNGHHILTYNHSGSVNAVAWSPNRNYIASASVGNIQVWETTKGRKHCSYRKHSGEVKAVAWSPNGTHIASGGEDKTVQIWDAKSGQTALIYSGHAGWMSFLGGGCVNAVAWWQKSHQTFYVVSASDDKTVQIWGVRDGQKLYTYRGHTGGTNAIALSPNGKQIASASNDGTVQIWIAP